MNYNQFQNSDIDLIDVKILRSLEKDARISMANLARKVGLSPPSVTERVKKLEDANIIKSYNIEINHQALGLQIATWLKIRPVPGQHDKVMEILEGLPEIVDCDRVTGEDCFLAKAYVKDIDALEKLINQLIPYAMTNTAIIQSKPFEQRISLPNLD